MKDKFNGIKVALSKSVNVMTQHHRLAEDLLTNGWYPISYVWRIEKDENESIDDFMERIITHKYNQLKEYCLELNPQRLGIIEEAFSLYEKENYIACIPLFFTQIDGIAKDNESSGMFSGKHKNVDPLKTRFLSNINSTANKSLQNALFFKLLHSDSFIGENSYENLPISKHTNETNPNENNSLNRHGIMHGNIEYKEYGSKRNAMKTICLMVYTLNLAQTKTILLNQN